MTGSGYSAGKRRPSGARRAINPDRWPKRASAPIVPLHSFDVRHRRELAHRRFVVSVVRRIGRIVSLYALDAVMLTVSAVGAGWLSAAPEAAAMTPALVAFVLLGLTARGSYRAGDARRDSTILVTGVLIGCAIATLLVIFPPTLGLTGPFLVQYGMLSVALLLLGREVVDYFVRQAYQLGIGLRRAIIVARAADVPTVLAGMSTEGGRRRGKMVNDQAIVGYLTPDLTSDPDALGSVADLRDMLDAHEVNEVVIASEVPLDALHDIADVSFDHGARVLVIPWQGHELASWADPTFLGQLPAYQLHPARLELPAMVLKRASDLVLASIGLVLAAPLFALIAVAIKIESRGAVFFTQRRVGLRGREFVMWKFRSMRADSEASQPDIAHLNAYADPRLFKLKEDPRITGVGRLLRRFSMDELPQLFNVLAGEMSIVGPRPPLPAEVRSYEQRHFVRLSVVPGLTGPWQVSGRNLVRDFEEVVRLEREYVETWSLRHDVEIMIRTVGVVISGEGAY